MVTQPNPASSAHLPFPIPANRLSFRGPQSSENKFSFWRGPQLPVPTTGCMGVGFAGETNRDWLPNLGGETRAETPTTFQIVDVTHYRNTGLGAGKKGRHCWLLSLGSPPFRFPSANLSSSATVTPPHWKNAQGVGTGTDNFWETEIQQFQLAYYPLPKHRCWGRGAGEGGIVGERGR